LSDSSSEDEDVGSISGRSGGYTFPGTPEEDEDDDEEEEDEEGTVGLVRGG
jgi:hypothetical protein